MSDTVQTFRAISWIILKWLLIALAVVIALSALVAGGFYLHHWYTNTRHVEKMTTTVEFSEPKCNAKYPIYVGIYNGSEKTIRKVSFTLQAKKVGYSNDIAVYKPIADDKIIKPGEGFATCWSHPELREKVDPQTLEWSLASISYYFED